MSRRTQAPGQYLGYSLQTSRLLDHLLQRGGKYAVSLEVLGDTATEDEDGHVVVEELKSRTSDNNPIADSAVEFWKTLRNWVEACANGTLDPNTTEFRLHVTRPFDSNIANSFVRATDEEEARVALDIARELLQARVDPSTPLGEQLVAVFSADPVLVSAIIARFELTFGSGSSFEDLKRCPALRFLAPEDTSFVLDSLLGWVKKTIDSLIEMRRPAIIDSDEFNQQARALVSRMCDKRLLVSYAGAPNATEIDAEKSIRTYAQQLQLVEASEHELLSAITDFLKSEKDRVEWARRGAVFASSFDDYEAELLQAWNNYKLRGDLQHARESDVRRGWWLLSDCCAHKGGPLDGRVVADYFCRGSFHRLADVERIGWHPDYRRELAARRNLAPATHLFTSGGRNDDSPR